MTYESANGEKNSVADIAKNFGQSLKVANNHTPQESNIDKGQMEARQRVFNQSPEYKKREIVFGQIQNINNRLSGLEEEIDDILTILKADK